MAGFIVKIQDIATTAEINAGVSNNKGITPANLKGSIFRRVYVQEEEPTDMQENDLWVKLIDVNNALGV